ncbi:MAG: helix-turn-helix transcriptional regulator [Ketobacter sp.]|nr:helix-turn-helix transcriptional regulator [Ketobacter sp.]
MALLHIRNAHMTPEDQVFYTSLGKRIAQARKAKGMTQVQLAEALGISQQTVAHYEGGRLRLPASMVPVIAKVVEVSVMELMGESDVKIPPMKRGPKSRLEQQVEQISLMPRSKQKFISEMLDALISQQQAS